MNEIISQEVPTAKVRNWTCRDHWSFLASRVGLRGAKVGLQLEMDLIRSSPQFGRGPWELWGWSEVFEMFSLHAALNYLNVGFVPSFLSSCSYSNPSLLLN
jgi:hypothetical protein